MYQIILSSTNIAKKEAVQRFFSEQKIDFELFCFNVDSGVAKTPETDEDGIIGCQNRIKNAKIAWQSWQMMEGKTEKDEKKLIFIGMEGILNRNEFGVFLGGWVCLEIDGQIFLALVQDVNYQQKSLITVPPLESYPILPNLYIHKKLV